MMDGCIQTPVALGACLRSRRRELRLTQQELASVARVTTRLLSEVERGKPTAQLDGLLRIVAALGLELHLASR